MTSNASRPAPRPRRLRDAVIAATVVLTAGLGGAAGSAAVHPSGSAQASCSIGTTALRYGSRGSAVVCLQRTLAAKGHSPGPVDGIFGSMTRAAVVAYQRANGLAADGIVGRATARSLGIWGGSCTPPSSVPSSARQVVVVDASGTTASVDLLVKKGTTWVCRRMDMYGRVGRNGIRPLAQRVSGDGTTPAGTFPVGSQVAPDGRRFSFFGNTSNPGVVSGWRQVRAGDCWDASGGDSTYNRLTHRSEAACGSPDEYLPRFQEAYSRAALIGANLGPNRSGDGPGEVPRAAAIFLHRHSYDGFGATRPTSGCVSLKHVDLGAVLRSLVPGEAWFVIR